MRGAIDRGDLMTIRSEASEMECVPLDWAAEIVLIILDKEPQNFEAAARRLVARASTERAASLRDLRLLIGALDEVSTYSGTHQRTQLLSVIGEITQRRRFPPQRR